MIREVQPEGPYRIGGYSFGAILAYEIATQLIGIEQEVELLALFDLQMFGTVDDRPLATPDTANQDVKAEFLSVIYEHLVSSGMSEPTSRIVLQLKQSSNTLEELIDYCREQGWLIDSWQQAGNTQIRRILTRVIEHRMAPYYFGALPVDIHLFTAQEERLACEMPDNFTRLKEPTRMKKLPTASSSTSRMAKTQLIRRCPGAARTCSAPPCRRSRAWR